jgi:hypothetical protein
MNRKPFRKRPARVSTYPLGCLDLGVALENNQPARLANVADGLNTKSHTHIHKPKEKEEERKK